MAQAALQARAAAAATVNESIRALRRYHTGVNPSSRLLQTKLDKLIADKEQLVASHYVYGEKSNKPLDSEEMLDWITPILDSVLDLSDEVFLTIDGLEATVVTLREKVEQQAAATTAKQNEASIAEKQYKANEKSLRERVTSMMLIVDDEEKSTNDDENTLRSYLHQIDEHMSEQVKSWN